jgi:hypothetical protein
MLNSAASSARLRYGKGSGLRINIESMILINKSLSNVAAGWLTIAESRRSDCANGTIHTDTTTTIN